MVLPYGAGQSRRWWMSVVALVVTAAVITGVAMWRMSETGSKVATTAKSAPSSNGGASSSSSSKKGSRPTTTTQPHPANGQPVTYDIPTDITSDCSSDVTARLLAWIDSTPDNSVLRFGTNACYEIEGVLYVEARQKLTFVGNGARFVAKTDGADQKRPDGVTDPRWPRRRAQWWFDQSGDISITNVSVTGSNPNSGQVDAQY